MSDGRASLEWPNASAVSGNHTSTRSEQHLLRRTVRTGTLLCADRADGPSAFLVETGIVAVFMKPGSTPATCVALAGPSVLLEMEAGTVFCYRPVGSVTLLTVPVTLIENEIGQPPTMRGLYLAQLKERLVKAEILATCNARHSVAQRCSRWLLTLFQHFGEDVPVTHAFLASLLGVRRAGVSVALERMQDLGIARQQRGRITVINPSRLAEHSCHCSGGSTFTSYPILPRLLQRDLDMLRIQARMPAIDANTLLAQSHTAIEASKRLIRETWRLRTSALHLIDGANSAADELPALPN